MRIAIDVNGVSMHANLGDMATHHVYLAIEPLLQTVDKQLSKSNCLREQTRLRTTAAALSQMLLELSEEP